MTVRPLAAALVVLASCTAAPGGPETRAVRFLAREVPAWPEKNRCFSCHNNGDAARALIAARRRSIPFDAGALDSTAAWLRRPEQWKDNGPPGDFSDRNLPVLQFAFALSDSGGADAAEALPRAAAQVASLQQSDGSWAVDADGLPGSPITYGRTLATVVAHRTLKTAGGFAPAVRRAEQWLRARTPAGPLDAGALLMSGVVDPAAPLERIRRGRSLDGGWGPYVGSPPETFDTAIVLLGLATIRDGNDVKDLIAGGREFIVRAQERDGSWPETTRPPGAESYAQRISTTGWATLALLATSPAGTSD